MARVRCGCRGFGFGDRAGTTLYNTRRGRTPARPGPPLAVGPHVVVDMCPHRRVCIRVCYGVRLASSTACGHLEERILYMLGEREGGRSTFVAPLGDDVPSWGQTKRERDRGCDCCMHQERSGKHERGCHDSRVRGVVSNDEERTHTSKQAGDGGNTRCCGAIACRASAAYVGRSCLKRISLSRLLCIYVADRTDYRGGAGLS